MKKNIIEDSLICLANAKLNDTSYEVARDIVLDYIIELKERINKAIEYIDKQVDELEVDSNYLRYQIQQIKNIIKGEE